MNERDPGQHAEIEQHDAGLLAAESVEMGICSWAEHGDSRSGAISTGTLCVV